MAASGNGHEPHLMIKGPPHRVVSLVPSMTESLFDLGLGDSLVGITDYCIYPPDRVAKLQRVGGTKNPSIDGIAALKPDLVLANQEENTRETVNHLEALGIKVWVTFPRTLKQSMDVLWILVGIYQSKSAALRLDTLNRALDWAEADSSSHKPWRFFCPIWQNDVEAELHQRWWMTFNQDTYMNDLLRLFGGVNIFSNRQRKYPLEADLGLCEPEEPLGRDTRYPRVTWDEVVTGNPQVIILPTEPYNYEVAHQDEFLHRLGELKLHGVREPKVLLVDGSLLTWHGTRLGKALTLLGEILRFE